MSVFDMMSRGSMVARAPEGEGGEGGGGGAGGAAEAAAAAALATGSGAGNPWYHGADAELIGHIQTKGWHDKPANEVALAAIQAHREAEKFIGVPADRVVHLPKDASDEAGIAAFRLKTGVPTEAAKYELGDLKFSDGTAPDPKFNDWFKETAFKAGLPQAAAAQLAADFTKFVETGTQAGVAERTAKLTEEHAALDANWGQNKAINLAIAQRGAAASGLTPEQIQGLENVVGYAKVMEHFRQVGELNGEAKFIGGGNGPTGSNGIMTQEMAVARKAELMNDQGWVTRYTSGDAQANRELSDLLKIIVGDDTASSRAA